MTDLLQIFYMAYSEFLTNYKNHVQSKKVTYVKQNIIQQRVDVQADLAVITQQFESECELSGEVKTWGGTRMLNLIRLDEDWIVTTIHWSEGSTFFDFVDFPIK
jgi:hypothetical protein